MKNKKGQMWLWIILALVVIGIIGVVAWFLITGSDGGFIGGGSSIPQPPILPN